MLFENGLNFFSFESKESRLFKFDSNFDEYIRNKLYQEKKYQIFPKNNDYNFNENNLLKVYGSQVVIIGTPKMNRLMEMPAQVMYDSITNLNNYSSKHHYLKINVHSYY